MSNFLKYTISDKSSIKDALIKLNNIPDLLVLFVLNEKDKLIGTLTDGDIRRGFIKGLQVSDCVKLFMHTQFRYLEQNNYTIETIDTLRKGKIFLVPLVDDKFKIIKIINFREKKSYLPVDAVIMAGGKGERLLPLTKKTPKPLLKIGDKSIIDRNVDRLKDFGIENFSITVNYLGNKIVDHFSNKKSSDCNLNFVTETEPLGTIGSLSLIKSFKHDYILVMNSDLLTNIDFEDFFRNFIEEEADMSVASAPYYIDVPYAILETNKNNIASFKEKPTFTYYSNAGIYLIKKELLKMIPIKKHYNATDFIEALINKKLKVIHFPILGYWLDIGKHEDFSKAQEDVQHIKF
jgi:dTDP-glucose pyrophosphorylase/CBS domain-containing protein